MILYHGSYKAIEKPDLSFSRLRTDFGKGFYLTSIYLICIAVATGILQKNYRSNSVARRCDKHGVDAVDFEVFTEGYQSTVKGKKGGAVATG